MNCPCRWASYAGSGVYSCPWIAGSCPYVKGTLEKPDFDKVPHPKYGTPRKEPEKKKPARKPEKKTIIKNDKKLYEYAGERMTITAWAETYMISLGDLVKRVENGMKIGDAIKAGIKDAQDEIVRYTKGKKGK